jgi:hypothetical protein
VAGFGVGLPGVNPPPASFAEWLARFFTEIERLNPAANFLRLAVVLVGE